jgi:hypothetical protein
MINRKGKFAWWIDFLLNVILCPFWIVWGGVQSYYMTMKGYIKEYPSEKKEVIEEKPKEQPYASKFEEFEDMPEDERE